VPAPATPRYHHAFVLLLVGVCSKDQQSQPPPGEAPAVAAAQEDTIRPFRGAIWASRPSRPAPPTAQLRGVRVTRDADFDRVVFEFADSVLPGYQVEYPEGPIRRCGSGDEVRLAGLIRLLVRLEPAQAHDEPAIRPSRTASGHPGSRSCGK